MRILVLDGNENQAVAAVRSLAAAGHTVVVGADTSWSKAAWSRSASGSFQYPGPDANSDGFIAAIADECARQPGTFVLPMTERTTLPISRERDVIAAAGGRFVLPAHDVVLRAFDKAATTRIAKNAGVDVPRTLTIASAADAQSAARVLRFPVVLKPRSSQEQMAGGEVRATGAPAYARTPEELLQAWADLGKRCREALAQEFVEGAGVGYFALMHHGELRTEFAHRRLRDVRPTGSGSSLRVSTRPGATLRDCALAVLKELRWHGVAMVEFRERPDGTPVFLEVNGRFWHSLALAVYAGANFPALLAEMAEHGDVATATSYREGVRTRWLLGDARHLVEVWRGAPAGFPGAFPRRWPTLAAVLTPRPGTYHDNFMLRDPLPEIGDWLDFALHKLRRRDAAAGDTKVWHAKRRPSHP